MPKTSVRLVLGLVLAVLFLWLIVRQIRLEDFRHALAGAQAALIVAALCAFTIGYASRIQRWRLMLQLENSKLTWTDCAGPLLASFAVNNVLPFRAGDVLRSFAYNSRLGTTAGVVVATLFVERLLDLLVVLGFLGAALTGFGTNPSHLPQVGGKVLIAASAIILIVLLFPRLLAPLALASGRATRRLAPRLGMKLIDEIHKGLAMLQHMAGGTTLIRLVAWSLIVWLSEGGVFWLAARALPSIVHPSASWLALPIGTLATLIPSTPGYVGTFDYFVTYSMVAAGNATTAAAAYAFLIHALLWLPSTLAGGLYLFLTPLKPHANLRTG